MAFMRAEHLSEDIEGILPGVMYVPFPVLQCVIRDARL